MAASSDRRLPDTTCKSRVLCDCGPRAHSQKGPSVSFCGLEAPFQTCHTSRKASAAGLAVSPVQVGLRMPAPTSYPRYKVAEVLCSAGPGRDCGGDQAVALHPLRIDVLLSGVWYCAVLFRVVSCCVVLRCVVLRCISWHRVVLCSVVWCGVLWCCVVLCCVVLCCVVLCCVVLCCVVLCCVVLCCVVLCCVVLCCVVCCGVPKALLPEGNGRDVYPRVQVNGRAVCLSARCVLVCCCSAGTSAQSHLAGFALLTPVHGHTGSSGPTAPCVLRCTISTLCALCAVPHCLVLCTALHCVCPAALHLWAVGSGQWAVGSGTSAMRGPTSWGQPPTATNRQPPTVTNRQPPPANRHQPWLNI